jgi:biotin carboxyl carrier protein
MKPVVKVDGQAVELPTGIDIVETEPGVYSVLAGSVVHEVRRAGAEVSIGGRRFEVTIEDPRAFQHGAGAAGLHGKASIVAPMPGKVVRLLVAVGDEVRAGQGIVVVEAMKMQNEMKAPREGKVTALEVRENDSVTAGTLLAVVE